MEKNFKLDSKMIKIKLDINNKEEALSQIAKTMENAGYVKESYLNAILNREKIFPTGLPTGEYGVAIPHTDVEHVNKPMVAIATLKNPLEFCVMGGSEEDKIDVRIIFMLAMKDGNAQLELLQNIVGIIQDSSLLEKIYNAESIEKVKNLIGQKL